jgi:hypothetical protein
MAVQCVSAGRNMPGCLAHRYGSIRLRRSKVNADAGDEPGLQDFFSVWDHQLGWDGCFCPVRSRFISYPASRSDAPTKIG